MNKYKGGPPRLSGYDYTSRGKYFITICTKNKMPYFGKIENGRMILSEMGIFARRFWLEIPQHFPNIQLDEFIIMPDHIHGIIIIKLSPESPKYESFTYDYIPEPGDPHPSDINGTPKLDLSNMNGTPKLDSSNMNGTPKLDSSNMNGTPKLDLSNMNGTPKLGVPTSVHAPYTGASNTGPSNTGTSNAGPSWKPNSIGSIINQYKRICTLTFKKLGFEFSWQRRYYDRIIRTNDEFINVKNYILNNPAKWGKGKR